MKVPSLDKLIADLSEMILGLPDGLPSATLHMVDDEGTMLVAHLATGSGAMVAPIARLMVARQDPAVAVLAVEAKAAITRPTVREEDDPDKQRLLRGELSVSGLPGEKRQQLLMIAGEDRAGNEAVRLWVAETPLLPGLRLRYKPFDVEIVDTLVSRMRPLYLFRELMATRRMTEYQARKMAREHATKELARMGVSEKQVMPFPFKPGEPLQ
jgi:hypothetical protein